MKSLQSMRSSVLPALRAPIRDVSFGWKVSSSFVFRGLIVFIPRVLGNLEREHVDQHLSIAIAAHIHECKVILVFFPSCFSFSIEHFVL